MKYGKKIRKAYRRTYRRFKRAYRGVARRIRGKKRFLRRIANVAEKKLITGTNASVPLYYGAAGNWASGILFNGFPAQGTGNNQRIGNSIFIRYLKIHMYVYNLDNTHMNAGLLTFYHFIEKTPGSANGKPFADSFGPLGGPNSNRYKDTWSKMFMKNLQIQSFNNISGGAAGQPPVGVYYSDKPAFLIKKYKVKVMKPAQLNNTNIGIKDHYFGVVYWDPPMSQIFTNPAPLRINYTLTYTDV